MEIDTFFMTSVWHGCDYSGVYYNPDRLAELHAGNNNYANLNEFLLPLMDVLRDFQSTWKGRIVMEPALLTLGSQLHDSEHDLVGNIPDVFSIFHISIKK
jgi:hypothetical protein